MTTVESTAAGGTVSASGSSGSGEAGQSDAERLTASAKRRVSEEADQRKAEAVKVGHSASEALKKAAGHLDESDDAPAWLASAFRSAATNLERFASKAEGQSAQDVGREASRFARENPGTFLAASAAAGFAAARLLRAGAVYEHHQAHGASDDGHSDYRSQGAATQGVTA